MIFLDCGFYRGVALQKYIDAGLVDDSWTIYAFEPNPEIESDRKLIRKAVWTHDGTVTFQLGGRDDASSIKGTGPHGDPREIEVESIDFSKFVSELPDEFIICSLDVEGAEFPILEKMLEEGTIDRIGLLDVEFHHRLLHYKTQQDSQGLLDKLINRTAVRLKVPLN